MGHFVYPESAELYFISALAATTLAGDVLNQGFITMRETDHLDAQNVSFFAYASRHSGENAFINRSISGQSLQISPCHWLKMRGGILAVSSLRVSYSLMVTYLV
jgi:hypothetical protein